ncbi:protein mono-ADP-ribosyltransferase PARP15 isoform X6 [Vulpes vulpes]|uniref:Poly [ADP-ribose] polymerase n=1 Tax=Vulpes vulpes TaxID=9627 RepID=A0ABM4XSP0_VULVU
MSRDQVSWKNCLSNRNVIASTQTKEGLNLVLISGDVIYFQADVIVNTVPMNLQLGGGPLSQALLQKAGPKLQKELYATRQGTEEEVGSIFMTSGCNLNCKAVLHVVAPHWDNGAGSSQQAFLDKFTTWSSVNPNEDKNLTAGGSQGVFTMVSSPGFATYEMKIGAVTFQIATGDITKEKADVIVNSTTRTFNLKSGVSKAVLEGAGPAVENECAVRAAQPHGEFIITQGGYLMCKIIIHVFGENDVRKTVSTVLEECEQRKYTSVALPAIGTGNAGKNPTIVADDMISAVVDFSWKHSTPSLRKVKVVIFLSDLLNVFYDNMKKRENSTSPFFQSTCFETARFNRQPPIICGRSTGTMQPRFPSTYYSSEGQNHSWETGIAKEQEENRNNIPEHWTIMNQQLSCVIELHPGRSEYDTVRALFSETHFFYKIEKIERIQNVCLWQSYQIKKKHMDIKNGSRDNERVLFHGTDADSVPYVNQHGFNRSYAGKNAAAYGKGTYFAVDARYSADDIYSRPDSNGRKHIYVVRVLTGVYTLGHAGLVTPPSKNPHNPTDLFDSVTNDTQHPNLFVVFSDNQAYPEYLITFRC